MYTRTDYTYLRVYICNVTRGYARLDISVYLSIMIHIDTYE